MFKVIIIQISFPESYDCHDICEEIINRKLAACIQQTSSIKSYYTWDNNLCIDNEYLLLLKTSANHFESIETIISNHHPYEVPEIISIDISNMSKQYSDWLITSVK